MGSVLPRETFWAHILLL